MVNVTFSVPDYVYRAMKQFPEIRWTEIARQAVVKRVEQIKQSRDPLRYYALKRLAEEGEDAEELFKF